MRHTNKNYSKTQLLAGITCSLNICSQTNLRYVRTDEGRTCKHIRVFTACKAVFSDEILFHWRSSMDMWLIPANLENDLSFLPVCVVTPYFHVTLFNY